VLSCPHKKLASFILDPMIDADSTAIAKEGWSRQTPGPVRELSGGRTLLLLLVKLLFPKKFEWTFLMEKICVLPHAMSSALQRPGLL